MGNDKFLEIAIIYIYTQHVFNNTVYNKWLTTCPVLEKQIATCMLTSLFIKCAAYLKTQITPMYT